jgi:hypothetical protein
VWGAKNIFSLPGQKARRKSTTLHFADPQAPASANQANRHACQSCRWDLRILAGVSAFIQHKGLMRMYFDLITDKHPVIPEFKVGIVQHHDDGHGPALGCWATLPEFERMVTGYITELRGVLKKARKIKEKETI